MDETTVPQSGMLPGRLDTWERALLLVPALLAGIFGVGLLLVPGNRFVGAEGAGIMAGLALALRRGDWTTARLPAVATLAFTIAALFACVATAVSSSGGGDGGGGDGGRSQLVLLLVGGATAVLAVSMVALLVWRRGTARPASGTGVGRTLVWFLALRTATAWLFGVWPLFFPAPFVRTFGVAHVTLFLYRLGGAGLVGYALMGVGELRSRCWSELRAPAVMVLVLAAFCAVVSLASLAIGERSSLGYLVAILASIVTAGTIIELRLASK